MNPTCKQCGSSFMIRPEDLAFYDEMSPTFAGEKFHIPAPTLCPDCRWQRRLSRRNERTLYLRKCDLTGKSMVSMHPADSPFPVYHITEWLSDKWDPLDYGRDFDFNRPFFEQFKEFCDSIPHFNLFVDPNLDVNSDYTNCSNSAKNCYLISQAEVNEDSYYSRGINRSKDCCDCLRIHQCELCYECTSMMGCYHCLYSQECEGSSDVYFSSNLKSCKNCFGCHDLVQKQYYFFNQPLSKEEWEKRMKDFVFTRENIEWAKQESERLKLSLPRRAVHTTQCENVSGDHLMQCKNSYHVFDCLYLEDCAYCYEIFNGAKKAYDYSMWGVNAEFLYECNGCGFNVNNLLFSNHCWQNVSNLLYCESCYPSVKDCFGCFGLRRKQYCIFNKQYSKEEYEKLVARILSHMQKTGEWGEFFPARISPYGYNESVAYAFFPMEKKEVEQRGWNWYEKPTDSSEYIGPTVKVPSSIAEVDDSICGQILKCEKTGKLYKIIPQELKLYRTLGVPLPTVCPEERHLARMRARNPRHLWNRTCQNCNKPTQSSYAPERPEKVFCEACYLKLVY